MSNAAGPIADLSYRSYEGTLDAPTQRWKVIARQNIMRVVKNKWYWVCFGLGGWYFGLMMVFLFIMDQMMQGNNRQAEEALRQLGGIDWTASAQALIFLIFGT